MKKTFFVVLALLVILAGWFTSAAHHSQANRRVKRLVAKAVLDFLAKHHPVSTADN